MFVELGITKPNSKNHSAGRRNSGKWALLLSQGSLASLLEQRLPALRTTNETVGNVSGWRSEKEQAVPFAVGSPAQEHREDTV